MNLEHDQKTKLNLEISRSNVNPWDGGMGGMGGLLPNPVDPMALVGNLVGALMHQNIPQVNY